LNKYLQTFSEYAPFVKSMRTAFNYFEKYREVPFVMVNGRGEYVTDESAPSEALVKVPNLEPAAMAAAKKKPAHNRPERTDPIPDNQLATSADKLPEYPGGNRAFQVFLNRVSKESVRDLAGQSKAFVMVEYVIDSTGKAVYAKAIRGGNDVMDEKIENAFLGMPQWQPATQRGNHVAMKLKQTVMVGD
ncbi:MAG TPA: hypothetical protein VKU83_10885, partial [Puia sp.]|nr:hypothetical protein [Puia sp.]